MKKSFKIVMYSILLACMFFIASCERKIYTITFIENGGTEVSDLQIPVNELPARPENPTKEGYTFAGWFLDEDFKFKYGFGKMESDITVYAKWDVNSYSISYVTNCPTQLSSDRVPFGSEIELSEAPARTGYDFVGWYTDAALKEEFTLTTMPAKNITVYAAWDAYDFTVKFISQDEEVKELEQIVEYGQTITEPKDLVREGYTFKGWYLDDEAYDFDKKLTDNVTLTAKWEINSYTITYDTDGGTEIDAATYTYRQNLVEPDRPTKTGYVFAGWTLNNESFEFSGAKMPANDFTLKVTWLAGDYAIYFNKNNSQASGTVSTIATKYDKEEEIPENTFELTGYTFVEWNTKADGTGTKYEPGTKVTKLTSTKEFTLYAIWSAHTYTVKFNANGGEGAMSDQELVYDITALDSNVFTKFGYSFAGWNTAADGTGTSFSANATNITSEDDATVELYAIWSPKSYTLTYEPNGANGTSVNQTVIYDTTKISANTFVRTGYTFVEWNTQADGEGRKVEVGTPFAMSETTLYAIWSENNYKVVLNANNGTTNFVEQEFRYTEEKSLTAKPESYTKTGYRFAGWSTSEFGRTEYTDGQTVKELIAEDDAVINLYAVWEANTYTIEFNANTGTGTMDDLTMTYDVAKNLTSNGFEKEGYTFTGWNTEADGTGDSYSNRESVTNLLTSGSITLYAQWAEHTYTVVFNANNGTEDSNEQVFGFEESKNLTSNGYSKDGYTFAGWSSTSTGRKEFDDGQTVSKLTDEDKGVINLYAVWEANTYTVIFAANATEFKGSMDDQTFTYDKVGNLTQNSFVRTGYTFLEWNTESDGTGTTYADKAAFNNVLTSGSITLYAIWDVHTYKVVFNANNGSEETNEQEFKYDVAEALDANKYSRTGYTFEGWSRTSTGSKAYDNGQTVNSLTAEDGAVINLYAIWRAHTYKIEFNANGGTGDMAIQDRKYNDNEALTNIGFTRTGYTFTGWKTSDGETYTNGQVANVTSVDKAIVTLYAQWKEHTYTVIFNANAEGVTGSMENQSFNYTDNKALTAVGYEKTGYTFQGWARTSTGSKTYDNNQKITGVTSTDGARIELYAVWAANTYTVIFDANATEFTGSMDDQTFTYDKAGNLTQNGYVRTGYTFLGWNTEKDGSGDAYDNQASMYNVLTSGSITLYAIWDVHTYKVVFNANNGSEETNEQEFKYDVAEALDTNKYSRTGYTFVGWSKTSTGNVAYTNGQQVSNLTSDKAGQVNLYAIWRAHTYTIEFNANGAEGSMANQERTYDDNKPLTANGFTRTGFTFDGWKTEDGEPYVNGYAGNITSTDTSTVTLYAQWRQHTYTVVYFKNDYDATGSMEIQEFKYTDYKELSLNTYEKEGYTFVGWATTSTGTKAYDDGQKVKELTSVDEGYVSLYAVWEANTYTVIFDVNDGDGTSTSQTFTYDKEETLKDTDFERTGYTFTGWNTASDGSGTQYAKNASFNNVLTSGSITLYAQWEENTYSIILHANYQNDQRSVKNVSYNELVTLTNPFTRTGYTFEYWSAKSNGEKAYENNKEVSKLSATKGDEVHFYAIWKANSYTVVYDPNGGQGTMENQSRYFDDLETITTNAFTREGYTFTSWLADGGEHSGTNIADGFFGFLSTEQGDVVTLIAQWEINTYYVDIFYAEGDGERLYFEYGKTITSNDKVVSVQTSADFDKWLVYNSDGEDIEFTFDTTSMPAKNITIYALLKNQSTVTFDYNCTEINAGTVQGFEGDPINKPASDPIRTGYTFTGWYADKQCQTEFDFANTMPAGALTIYAGWDAHTYTVTFDGNGADRGDMANQTRTYDDGLSLTPNAFERDGYTFLRWAVNGDVNNTYEDKEIANLASDDGATVILVAQWYEHSYTIVYHGNGANTGSMQSHSQRYTEEVTLSTNLFNKTGYTFDGWATSENGNVVYKENAEVSKLSSKELGEFNLYAVWTANTYTVIFDVNDGDGTSTSQTFTYDKEETLKDTDFERTGYTFTGWNTASDGSGTQYAKNASFNNVLTSGSITLYAQWREHSYTLVLNANDGTTAPISTKVTYEQDVTLTNTFTREGYTFAGWAESATGNKVYDNNKVVEHLTAVDNETVTLYVVWTAHTYTVEFNSNGGDGEMVNQSRKYDDGLALTPNAFEREGYTFDGWLSTEGKSYIDGQKANLTSTDKSTVTLYAQWREHSYTLVLNANDGSETPDTTSDTVTYEQDVTLANTFTKTGYTFEGWALTADGNVEYTENQVKDHLTTVDNGTVTLYAVWAANTYTVVFDVNGGDGTSTSQTFTYDKEETLKDTDFERTGYTFTGWNTASDGSGTQYAKNASFNNVLTSGSMTLYAQWREHKYTVVFHSNDGNELEGKQEFNYSDTKALTANAYSRVGYTFDGWLSTEGKSYGDGQEVGQLTAEDGAVINLYAIWRAHTYTVEFNANGGTGDMANQDRTYNDGLSLTPNAFERDGYTFTGWKTADGDTYADGQVVNLTTTDKSTVTLYAQWREHSYTLVLNANDGSETPDTTSDTVTYEEDVKLENPFTRTGYTFAGWATSEDGSKVYSENQEVEHLTAKDDGLVTLYAIWQANTYVVEYNANATTFTGSMDDQTFTYDVAGTLTANGFDRVGYTFDSWNTKADGTGTKYANASDFNNVLTSGSMTLYAQWNEHKYTVVFHNGSTVINEQSFNYSETKALTANTVTKTGYIFAGWSTSQNGTTVDHTDKAVVGPLTTENGVEINLYAVWTAHTYTIKFDANTGLGTMENQTFTYDVTTNLTANSFAKTGYSFVEWNTLANGQGDSYDNEAAIRNLTAENGKTITLYAIWSENSYTVEFYNGETYVLQQTFNYSETKTLTASTVTKTGYTFAGWSTTNGGAVVHTDGKTVGQLAEEDGAVVKLYAVWTANTYTVVFNANGAEGNMSEQEMTYDVSVLNTNTFTKYGYTFAGWNTASDGTGTPYSQNSSENLTAENGATITLYAQWSANTYNLTYKPNGAEGVDLTQGNAIFATTALLTNSYSRTGYEFVGWTTNAEGTGTVYAAGSKLATTETTLYAQWNELSYVVTLQHGKTDASVSLDPVLYSGKVTLSLPSSFTYEGYTLVGWALDESEEMKFAVGQEIDLTELNLNHTYKTANLVGWWEPNTLTITFIDSSNSEEIEVLETEYDKLYTDLSLVTIDTYISEKYGYRYGGYFTDSNLSTESQINFASATNVFTQDMTVYVKLEAINYTVKFILDGETIYSVDGKHYGDSLSFNDYVIKLTNDLPVIKKFENLLLVTINGASATELPEILQGSAGTVGAVSYSAGEILNVYAVDSRIQTAAATGDIPGLYSIVNTIKNDIEFKLASYKLNSNNQYVPTKENLIFGDWVLGDGMFYNETEGERTVYKGKVPASNDSSEDGTIIKIIGKWKGVPAITGVTWDKVNNNLSWNAVELDDSIKNPTITYEIYHEFEVDGSTVKTLMDAYVPEKVENSVVSYSVNIDKPGQPNYFAPGEYKISIKAIIEYTDEEGNTITLTSEDSKQEPTVMSISSFTIAGITLNEGDYYLQKDNDGEITFYFFTDMEYTFENSTFEFVNSMNTEIITDGRHDEYVKIDGSNIITTNKTETSYSFYFRTKEKTEKYYLGIILPFVSQFDFGENLQQYNSYTNGSLTSLYLEDLSQNIYQIGVNTNTNGNVALTKTVSSLTYDNGFVFDLSVKSTGGKTIDVSKYSKYFVYEFKDVTNNVVIPNEIMGYYDEITNAWYFNEKLLTHRYDSTTSSLVEDTNAANIIYEASIEINKEYVPLILTDKEYGNGKVGKGLITAKKLNFQLNDGINVFTHDELKAVYEDIHIKTGINIHANITARLDNNQIYSGEYGSSVFDSRCYAWNIADTSTGQEAYNKALGSVINPELYDYMTLLKQYEAAGKTCKDLPTGHVYMRASASDLQENYVINGNLFNIDASQLGYASIYSVGNLSSISGYQIVNTKTSIFTYLVTNYTGNDYTQQYTMTSTSSITFNDLSIKGNTKNSSLASDGIELMNKNSGGHCGIQSWYGATMNINNTVITNSTIAVYIAQNSSANVDYLYSASNWANTIYSYGGESLRLTNSYIKDSGGAAIHFEDLKSTTTNPTTATIYFDNTTKFENYVSGEEGYFKANSMEIVVLTLKSGFENISQAFSNKNYTLINTIKNEVTGNTAEKLNLILLAPAAGKNKSNSGESSTFGGNWAGQNMVNVEIGNTTNAPSIASNILGSMSSMNSATIDATVNGVDYGLSDLEPGFGIFFVANGDEKASSGLYKDTFYVTSYATGKSVMGTATIVLGAHTN